MPERHGGVSTDNNPYDCMMRVWKKQRVVELHHKGIDNSAIAERLGMPYDTVKKIVQKAGLSKPPATYVPWTDEETNKAFALLKAGYSAAQIADQVGRSRNSVIGKLARSGKKSWKI